MDIALRWVNTEIVDPLILGVKPVESFRMGAPYLPYDPQYSLLRQCLVLWAMIYVAGVILYLLSAGTTYFLFFRARKNGVKNPDGTDNAAWWHFDKEQVKAELFTSFWSMIIMTGMTVPLEMAVIHGHTRVYHEVDEYGWGYLLLSPILFIFFTDCLIYFIHRGLHWGPLYGPIHKLHHRFKNTTPFSAFSFHPVDGWLQGLPYHLFVFIFPMHNIMYSLSVFVVSLWTVNIHDRVTLRLFGVNGAAHHTVHHTKFNYNYGQYFVLWDWLLGTFKDPYAFPQYDASFDFSQLSANELKDISLLDPDTVKRRVAERKGAAAASSGNGNGNGAKLKPKSS